MLAFSIYYFYKRLVIAQSAKLLIAGHPSPKRNFEQRLIQSATDDDTISVLKCNVLLEYTIGLKYLHLTFVLSDIYHILGRFVT